MKTIVYNLIVAMLLLFVSACEKEGDKLVVTGPTSIELLATASEVQLNSSAPRAVALQLMWNAGDLTSTANIAQSQLKTSLQFSASESFATIGRAVDLVSSSASYTNQQLNTMALAMGFLPDAPQPMYVRVASRLANNVDPLYSNIIRIEVTAYEIASSEDYLYMANPGLSQFDWKLCSRLENGIYDGFVQVNINHNFLLTNEASEDAGTIYGSYPVDGNQYLLYKGTDRWNCWTSKGGYLYIKADVNELTWSETAVTSLTVSGDFNGWSVDATPMTYDAENKIWTATVTTTEPEQWGIKILINKSWTWFFGGSDIEGECNLYTSDAGGFAYDKVGTYKLILDLSDPKSFKYRTEEL